MTVWSWFKVLAITLCLQAFLVPFMWGAFLDLRRFTAKRRLIYGTLFGPLFVLLFVVFRPTTTEAAVLPLLCGAAAIVQGIALAVLHRTRHKPKLRAKPIALLLMYGLLATAFAILAMYFLIYRQSYLLAAVFLIASCAISIRIIIGSSVQSLRGDTQDNHGNRVR